MIAKWKEGYGTSFLLFAGAVKERRVSSSGPRRLFTA